ncbi:polyprenyl synthetase family protein [bacterium]|nr:polyprenyl synthetase family protein [bacterium]
MKANRLDSLLVDFEAYRAQHPVGFEPRSLYEPAGHLFSLGGKRQRPVLVLTACTLYSGHHCPALPAALAIETFHTFSLVHDDIMDAAPLRRGQPTVHTRWGTATAILAGDALLVEAYRLLTLCPEAVLKPVLVAFNQMGRRLCEGQQLDMDGAARGPEAERIYFDMIEAKTGVLMGCALQIGAMIGGATSAQAEALRQYGTEVGLAFQLMDDWLDCFGTQALIGKEVGGDLREAKRTWLWIQLEQRDPELCARLTTLGTEERVAEGLAALRAHHLDQALQTLAETHLEAALHRLSHSGLGPDEQTVLRDFALGLVRRNR